MNAVLIGYRCTGKTSVGRVLAARLRRPFRDADELIAMASGKSVREMVEEKGWDHFRQEERRIIAGLSGEDGCVIALGGGAVLDEENVRSLKPRGFFVWLMADGREILRRMIGDGKSPEQRPSLWGKDLKEETEYLLKIRGPVYAKIADCRVDTSGRNIEEIAEEILAAFQKPGERKPERRKQNGG